MPKYLVNNYFTHGRFPEVGQKQKTEKKKKKKERAKVGDNKGQATHGARKHAWRTQAAWATRSPWRIFLLFFLRLLLLTHFGESPMCEITFHPIFWDN